MIRLWLNHKHNHISFRQHFLLSLKRLYSYLPTCLDNRTKNYKEPIALTSKNFSGFLLVACGYRWLLCADKEACTLAMLRNRIIIRPEGHLKSVVRELNLQVLYFRVLLWNENFFADYVNVNGILEGLCSQREMKVIVEKMWVK